MESEALVEFGKPLKRIKTDTPTPQGKEVLIKVTFGGVCHSDVHIHDGYFDLGGGVQLPSPLPGGEPLTTVSYTHLTLPTSDLV